MKKNFLLTLIIVLSISVCLNSCSKKQDLANSDKNVLDVKSTTIDGNPGLDLSNLGMDLSNLQLSELPLQLFTYEDIAELNRHLETTFLSFLDEIDELAASDERINQVLYNISYSNNAAVLNKIYFLDTDNEQVIDILDIGSTSSEVDWEEIAALLYGSCKEGWKDEGSCSSKSCIAKKTETILSAALDSNGDCVQLEYSRGLLSVKICSRPCP